MRNTNDPEITAAAEYLAERYPHEPQLAFILGSGLGSFADEVEEPFVIPAREIPGYPVSTVPGHAGRLVMGRIEGVEVIVVQGRIHYYEGYPISQVVLPVRLVAALGARGLMVTNAAGGIDDRIMPGDLMVITDHVNLMGVNPLVGQSFGFDLFPDMSRAYDPDLIKVLRDVADDQGLILKEGILGGWSGPSYETAAEIRMLKTLGVCAACMSTIPEVIAAARLNLRTVGISCITNKGTGLSETPLTHREVTEVAGQVENRFRSLLKAATPKLVDQFTSPGG